jgi:hypothetical protein
LDLSDLGEQIADAIKKSIEQGSYSFGEALSSDRLGENWERGMDGLAKNMGRGFEKFNDRAATNLFPRMSETFRQFTGTVFNTRNL